ncbi:hypothetical protein EDD11_007359 [Mortierella claussenii]|nr:hypothetical protein EDD11_007359 [Mortierella claussenii]
MSSRDHQHSSSSSSRKRDRSPAEDRDAGSSSRKLDRDDLGRDRSERNSRNHHSSSHSSGQSSSRRDHRDSSPRTYRSSRDDGDRERASKKNRDDRDRDHGRDRDRDRGSSRKSSKRDTDKDSERKKDRHRRSSKHHESDRSDDSGSESETDSNTGSESEENEAVRKAKSLIKTISEDDYFAKSAEFRLWLRKSKKKYFEDLSADDARRYFRKFVRAWNDFDLDESYYKGIRSSQMASKDLTKYQWGFAKKIDKVDQSKVEAIRDSIDTMTNTRFAQEVSRITGKSTATASPYVDTTSRRTPGPSLPPPSVPRRPMTADEVAEKEERDEYNRRRHRAEQKAHRKEKEAILEELVPKATGREAMLEKRRAQTAYHRRERSPDVELPEQDLMGTGGDDFKSMLAAERRRKEAREAKRYGGVADVESRSVVGPSAPSQSSAGSSLKESKQQAYKEKEEKQLEAFRQLWAQTQAAKGGL